MTLAPDYLERWRTGFPSGDGEQEAALLEAFRGILPVGSVLDVGCNIGRMGYLLGLAGFDGFYHGIDQDPVPLETARHRFPDGLFTNARIQDFKGGPYELVVATEVLMHINPLEVGGVVEKLADMAEVALVTCDWSIPLPEGTPIDPANWCQDYAAIYSTLGLTFRTLDAGPLQRVFVVTP